MEPLNIKSFSSHQLFLEGSISLIASLSIWPSCNHNPLPEITPSSTNSRRIINFFYFAFACEFLLQGLPDSSYLGTPVLLSLSSNLFKRVSSSDVPVFILSSTVPTLWAMGCWYISSDKSMASQFFVTRGSNRCPDDGTNFQKRL